MPFRNLAEILEPLVLPIGGTDYTIPLLLGGPVAKRIVQQTDPKSKAKPMADEEFHRLMLGPAYAEMLRDNVPHQAVVRAAMTALADYQRGRAVAELLWETGGDPSRVAAVAAEKMAELESSTALAEA